MSPSRNKEENSFVLSKRASPLLCKGLKGREDDNMFETAEKNMLEKR